MKKKNIWILAFAVVCLVLVPTLIYSAQATDAKQGTVAVPITTGLTGSDSGAKTFYLDLPSGVSSSAIKSGTFKYSGNNSVVGAITVENGKIKLTLKGNEKVETFSVLGTDGRFDKPFTTTPGNSIWRYADGRRWQINDYKEDKGYNVSYNKNAEDHGMPSAIPPETTVSTKSDPVSPSTATWYRKDQTPVPYSSVIQSSIKLHPRDLMGDKGIVNVKNGKFVITYSIPSKNKNPEQVSDSFDKGQWVEGRLYYVTLPYYFNADAKLTSYSYAGTVTFDYTLPTEPTLTGNAILTKPNPNPTKFEGKDVPVQISVKGELLSYTDTSNIEEWVFYAKEKGSSNVQTKKEYSKTLKADRSFDFTIPKSKVVGSSFTQDYDLSVVVRFKKPVVTKGGKLTSLTESFNASAGVYTTPNPPGGGFPGPVSPPNPPKELKPPVAVITAPSKVKAGEEFEASGAGSYDLDGLIKSYYWDAPNSEGELPDRVRGTIWYTKEQIGEQTIALTVVDDDSLSGSTSKEITVIEPKPDAAIYVSGTLKQNRKVILENGSRSPKHYPLVASKTKVTVTALSGGSDKDIKYNGSLNGLTSKEILFKQPGKYKATIYVENTLGLSASTETTFEIVPDQAPTVYFTTPGKTYRNPEKGNKAIFAISDMSFSPDQDIIDRRIWEYRYDSNNNGKFTDESWVVFSNENKSELNLEVSDVGKYEIRMTAIEEFGQPTIDEFVTKDDRKSADSYTDSLKQALIERTVEVINLAPEVDWDY